MNDLELCGQYVRSPHLKSNAITSQPLWILVGFELCFMCALDWLEVVDDRQTVTAIFLGKD